MFWKKISLKGNITTTYIENKHKKTGTSVLIHPQNVEKYFLKNKNHWNLILDFLLIYEVDFPG